MGPWLEAVVKPTWTKLRESTIYIYMKLPKLLPTPHFKDIDELKKPLGYGSDGPTTFNICGNKM